MAKVIDATYKAVHTGVTISLAVAGAVILASGLLAMLTFGRLDRHGGHLAHTDRNCMVLR